MDTRTHVEVTPGTPVFPPGTQVRVYSDPGLTMLVLTTTVNASGGFSYQLPNGVYYEKIGSHPAYPVSFDDSKLIIVSSEDPTPLDGQNGDIWFKYV